MRDSNKIIEKIKIVSEASENPNNRRDAKEMLDYFIRNGRLPKHKRQRALEIIELNKEVLGEFNTVEILCTDRRYFLYAISDGDFVKVGYTNNIKERMRTLQVGQPRTLELLWKTFCALDSSEARKQERLLHNLLRKYRVQGEWYRLPCMHRVYSHQVRNQEVMEDVKAERINKMLDEQAMAGI